MYTLHMSYHSFVDSRCLLGQVKKNIGHKSLFYQTRNDPTNLQMQTLSLETFV